MDSDEDEDTKMKKSGEGSGTGKSKKLQQEFQQSYQAKLQEKKAKLKKIEEMKARMAEMKAEIEAEEGTEDEEEEAPSDGDCVERKKRGKAVSRKDLPQFSGQSFEDAIAFLSRYERTGRFYQWTEKDKLEYLYLCFDRAAQSWHESVRKQV